MMTTAGSSTAFSGSSTAWRDLPRHYGRVGTVSSRFYRWRRSGVWQHVLEALQALADTQGRVGWELHFLDSTVVRAHQHAAGARKTGREPGAEDEALGRSRGGFTIHVRCEGSGKPVTFTLTGGQVHDSQQVTALINRGAIRRIGRGRPRLRPAKLAGDKAYSSQSIRLALRKRGITPVIPTKANERRQPNFDREAYRQRNIVERMINRLKNFRRIATRYEKRAANYLAMITIGAILLWI
jgi:transposase